VDQTDFVLTSTGVAGEAITNVSVGPGAVYTVTVGTGTGDGTIRLDVVDNDSIVDGSSNPLGGVGLVNGDFSGGETYTILHNLPPTDILLSASNVTENLPAGTTVGALSAVDPDPADTHTFAFCGGADNAAFALDGNTLKTAAMFDYEAKNAYTVCIRASDGTGNTFDKSLVVHVIDVPGLELIEPFANQTLHYNRPVFDWVDYPGATAYIIQISRNSQFTSILLNARLLTTNSLYASPRVLPANTTFYWRVRARAGGTLSPWSEIRNFRTANPPRTPVLRLPLNGSILKDATPLLDWTQSIVPIGTTFDHYQVQLDDNSNFSSPVLDVNINDLTDHQYVVPFNLTANTRYYWHVRAWNSAGDYSTWSVTRGFLMAAVVTFQPLPSGTSFIPVRQANEQGLALRMWRESYYMP